MIIVTFNLTGIIVCIDCLRLRGEAKGLVIKARHLALQQARDNNNQKV